jgi:acyl-CoA thioesterase-1
MIRSLVSLLFVVSSLVAIHARAEAPKPVAVADYSGVIQVCCIGDSITQGAGSSKPWPKMLGEALGEKWKFHNFGISARTLLAKGDFPYTKEKKYQQALELKPDVVLLALGTNDSKPHNWKHKAEFVADYKQIIADMRQANPKVRVYVLLPIPAYPSNFGITDAVISSDVLPLVKQVAAETKSELIDLNTPMLDQAKLVPDKVHPNAEGHKLMAGVIYEALTGTKPAADAITTK